MPAPDRSVPSAPHTVRGYVVGPDEGVPGRGPEVKCSASSTGSSLALYQTVVDGQGTPPHRHVHEDETIVVLDGTMQAECGNETWTRGPGDHVLPAARTAATFRSVDGPATILFIVTPGGLDEFFRLREQASSPEEIAELVARFL